MTTNPALADLEPLLGSWRMELYNAAFLPDPDARVSGSIAIDWLEGGAAVVIRQGDQENPPAAKWIIGRDESDAEYLVLYYDDRGVSRVYQMSLSDGSWKLWRDHPEFSQRFVAVVEQDGQRISGRWEKSFDAGETWEHDFNLDYVR
jgi:hypothetical protein